jgi:hypothetical protein
VTAEIKRSRRLTDQQRLYITCCDLADGVSGASFRSATQTEKRTICPHVHSEPMQVQHIAANSVNTKEWRTITEPLKYDDRIQIVLL